MTDELLHLRDVAAMMEVSGNQAWTWYQRREANGFPEAVAQVHITTYPGDKRKAPMFDPAEIVEWCATYEPLKGSGSHWAAKRPPGTLPKMRGRRLAEWKARNGWVD